MFYLCLAEAARRRYRTAGTSERASTSQAEVEVIDIPIDSLVTLATRVICAQIVDPRRRMLGLQGIPHDLAQEILKHLIAEKKLSPTTLRVFRSW